MTLRVHSVYLLYWYTSTNTDFVVAGAAGAAGAAAAAAGAAGAAGAAAAAAVAVAAQSMFGEHDDAPQ